MFPTERFGRDCKSRPAWRHEYKEDRIRRLPPEELANRVAEFVRNIFPNPSVIVEPACGLGNFITAALPLFNKEVKYYGFDVNEDYIRSLAQRLATCHNDCITERSDFFKKDWETFFSEMRQSKILIIGNPPWVTNSALGVLNSKNTPNKSNFQRRSGFAAKVACIGKRLKVFRVWADRLILHGSGADLQGLVPPEIF